jgi:CHASE3 domain sensor protein
MLTWRPIFCNSAAETYSTRHGLAADAASQKMRAALDKGREVMIAAQAERARLQQTEELRKAQELKHTFRPRGPSLGM